MLPKTAPRLSLELLESREVPSVTASSAGGTLAVRGDNFSHNVVILEAAPGTFAVTTDGKALGTFPATNISVVMGHANDTVDLGVKTSLAGYLFVNLGGGDDSFTTRTNSVVGARINGNVVIYTGASIQAPAGAYDDVVELYNLTFAGPSVQVRGSPGSSVEQLDVEAANIFGQLQVTNVYETDLGLPSGPGRAARIGSLIVNNFQKNTDGRTGAPDGPGNELLMFSGSRIDGSLTYTGGPGRDDIDLPAEYVGTAPVYVGGDLKVIGNGGINTLALGNGTNGAVVGGGVTFIGGADVDRFFFDGGSSVARDVTVSLGGGNNQLFGDSTYLGTGPFDPSGAATVGGSLNVTLGDGDNFIDTYAGDESLSVSGGVSFTVGNGHNVGFGSAMDPSSITFFNAGLSVGGSVSYRAGHGSQHLEIGNGSLKTLTIALGGGGNTVDFTTATFGGDLTIDFGVGPGPKKFETDPIPTTFTGRKVLRNFP